MPNTIFPGGFSSDEFRDELWKHLLEAMCGVDETLEELQLEDVKLSSFAKSDVDEALAEGGKDDALVTITTHKNEAGQYGYHVSVRIIVDDEVVFEGEFSWGDGRYLWNGTIDDLAETFVSEDDDNVDEEDELLDDDMDEQ